MELEGWKKSDGNGPRDQIVNGEWYRPIFGCDSLQMLIESFQGGRQMMNSIYIREKILSITAEQMTHGGSVFTVSVELSGGHSFVVPYKDAEKWKIGDLVKVSYEVENDGVGMSGGCCRTSL